MQKTIFSKIFVKNISKKIYFNKKISQNEKNIFKTNPEKKVFVEKNFRKKLLATFVKVSSSGLKLKKNENFLLQWIEMG